MLNQFNVELLTESISLLLKMLYMLRFIGHKYLPTHPLVVPMNNVRRWNHHVLFLSLSHLFTFSTISQPVLIEAKVTDCLGILPLDLLPVYHHLQNSSISPLFSSLSCDRRTSLTVLQSIVPSKPRSRRTVHQWYWSEVPIKQYTGIHWQCFYQT